ncbi:5'-nucleotidase SurE [Chloroflexota bacterium]|nr:5'-nucleotidase SurE [Chloroflexota bacterium]
MTSSAAPLIVLTNDDGVQSPGLAAAVTASKSWAKCWWSHRLCSSPAPAEACPNYSSGAIAALRIAVAGRDRACYAVDGSPAQCVQRALLVLAQRPVALVVAGINYGENVGSGITISGQWVPRSRRPAWAWPRWQFHLRRRSISIIRTLQK